MSVFSEFPIGARVIINVPQYERKIGIVIGYSRKFSDCVRIQYKKCKYVYHAKFLTKCSESGA